MTRRILLIVAATAALFAWRIDGWAWRARLTHELIASRPLRLISTMSDVSGTRAINVNTPVPAASSAAC
jgi:hypothetical protein